MKAKPRMSRTGSRAPRATAARPASIPAQPIAIAIHSETTVTVAVRCSGCHHGGWAAPATAGTARLGPPAETTTMTSTDATTAAKPAQASTCAPRFGLVPSVSLTGQIYSLRERQSCRWQLARPSPARCQAQPSPQRANGANGIAELGLQADRADPLAPLARWDAAAHVQVPATGLAVAGTPTGEDGVLVVLVKTGYLVAG